MHTFIHIFYYKQRFIAGSSSCSTKTSKLLTSILTTVKDGLKKYSDVIYSHSGINQMWILKNSKELLDNLQSHSLTSIHSIKHMIFRPFYTLSAYFTLFYRSVHVLNTGTTIPHTKLKARLSELIKNAFKCKNGKKRYEYIVVGYNSTYFVKNTSNAKNK